MKEIAVWYKKVNTRQIEQQVPEDDDRDITQPPLASQPISRVSPMTFSQKFYQSHELEIAEEFEQALENNSLGKIKDILDKILEQGEDS